MYSTGTAAGPKATLQALATFATSAGFTVDNNAAYSGGWWLAVHKGSCYLNFVSDSADTQITLYGATGFSGAGTPSTQAQTSPGVICNCGAGPYTGYHFFSTTGTAPYLHCVIEKSAGVFAHFQGGALNAVGGASPCIYVHVTNWDYSGVGTSSSSPDYYYNRMPWDCYGSPDGGHVGLTVDSTFRWFSNPNSSANARCIWPIRPNGFEYYAFNRSPNTFNGLPILLLIKSFVERAATNTYAYVGDAPDMRFLNMKNNNPKDELTIGADTWKIFPVVSNSPIINTNNAPASSGNYALAFRKNA